MLEIREHSQDKHELYFNGRLISEVFIWKEYNNSNLKFNLSTSFNKFCKELLELQPNTLLELNKIRVNGILEWIDSTFFESYIDIYVYEDSKNIGLELNFAIQPKPADWNLPFSVNSYTNKFIEIWEKESEFYCDLDTYAEPYDIALSILYHLDNFQKSILEEVNNTSEIIKTCHNKVVNFLISESNDTMFVSFDFPNELKVSCKQYLEYFATFLRDLGLNATSNLKEEAGKVLFSITLTDDIEALDKIREALVIYLNLSSNPISHSTGDRTVDMILSGARANAKHLESQLELAIAKLQFKEATLELKDATIEQNQLALRQRDDTIKGLKEMLAKGNIFEESLQKVVINGEVIEETSLYRFSREDDIEVEATTVLDVNNEETRIGLVKFHEVTKLKDYGVSLDLPKAIRDLIDYFKRDKNK